MPSIDPIGAAASGLQTLVGLGQTIFSGKKKAERNLENYANSYQPNQSIMDFYNKAYARYNPNAYNSAEYQNAINQNNRSLVTGINAAQDRRGALATIGSLTQGVNDANANAAARAEAAQRANLGMLGTATGMKAQEEAKKYDLKYNLLAMKAAAANATRAAGLKNISGGLQSLGELQMANKSYGG